MAKLLFKFQQRREQEISKAMISVQEKEVFDLDSLYWGNIGTFHGFNYDYTCCSHNINNNSVVLVLPHNGGVYRVLNNHFYPMLRQGMKHMVEDNEVLYNKEICIGVSPLWEVLWKLHLRLPKGKKQLSLKEMKIVENEINERLRTREIVFNNN